MKQHAFKSRNYEGWNTNSHLRTFEFWNALSNRSFNFMYGSFQENKYLIELIKTINSIVVNNCTLLGKCPYRL